MSCEIVDGKPPDSAETGGDSIDQADPPPVTSSVKTEFRDGQPVVCFTPGVDFSKGGSIPF